MVMNMHTGIKIITSPGFILISLVLSLNCKTVYAEMEINTSFLKGMDEIPSILKRGVDFPAGQYYLDVTLNNKKPHRMELILTAEEEETGHPCFTSEWLKEAGVFINEEAFADTFDSVRNCYLINKKESARTDLNISEQKMDISIPQAWLLSVNDGSRWDYGINGMRLKYNGNFRKEMQRDKKNGYSDDSLNSFGNFNAIINAGRWILSSNVNATSNAMGTEFTTNDLSASTAISQIKGNLLLGRSQTRSELFSDFSFYGFSLLSDSKMRSLSKRGYAPVITGVASTTSRVTVEQDGYTIYSEVVPPGPWSFDDISSVSNGNIFVTVEDSDGKKTITEYPVSTLPSLLRKGDYNYNFAIGQKAKNTELSKAFSDGDGVFTLGSLDYGFDKITLNMSTILHERYQGVGIGFSQTLGAFGAMSLGVNASHAEYDDNTTREGASATLKYAKNISDKTDVQLLTYRYQSPGYTEFSNWDPRETFINRFGMDEDFYGNDSERISSYRYVQFSGREKARYEARLSHRFEKAYVSGTFWQQSYWDRGRDSFGATLSASTNIFDSVSVYLSGNYSRSTWTVTDEYSASIGVSIPFSYNKLRYYNNNNASYDRNNGMTLSSTTSTTLNERAGLSVVAATSENRSHSAGISANYAFDRIQTNASVNKSKHGTTLSGNVSGSVIATKPTGLMFSKEASDTIAVLKIKDTPGVTFNNSLPSNSDGNAITYLSPYNPTTININPEHVPESTELLNTSYEVVPTEKAIIYREFGFNHVKRYYLRVYDKTGNVLSGGSAKTEQGINAGFIASNGVLIMNLLAEPKELTIKRNGVECKINTSSLMPNINKIQEMTCGK